MIRFQLVFDRKLSEAKRSVYLQTGMSERDCQEFRGHCLFGVGCVGNAGLTLTPLTLNKTLVWGKPLFCTEWLSKLERRHKDALKL